MYTPQSNRQIERQFDREGEEVDTDRCIQHRAIDRERGGGGRHRQMYTTENNRQIERYFDREQEEVDTDRCVQQRTIDRERQ